ncbi:ABC transporter permease [Methylobacterium sp. Leaf456]|uniref:ABC transporter permease subunit n=1 Tax=Methylobacterium sp. Leaf456 TaxID=1736382 RepID=UPI0006F76042|nr:ABC transporter permease subunit [Methylobacterium sp. Leaf456]KQT57258.1 ABC transporter permease [Methylobacterium sp. Leaf456]
MTSAPFGVRAVLLPLAAALALPLVLGSLPLLHLAPNRLVTGAPIPVAAALGPWLWPLLALAATGPALVASGRGRAGAWFGLLACTGGFALLLTGLGAGAAELLVGQPPAARARLAAGAWLAGLGLCAGIFLGMRASRLPAAGWLSALVLLTLIGGLGAAGTLDAFSLTVEFRARRDGLARAILEHLALSSGALIIAGLVTAALGLWRRGRGAIDLFVGGVQVVPAVALLGGLVAVASAGLALMPALRAYGVSALGAGPALVGMAAYLLLPLWRGLQGALRTPDPATLDAARALGLTPRQTLASLRLPLGAGLLIGGLRVAAVQALGLATLAPLVGAGGLGRLVFDGMAQFAPDLILLGALPVIALSLAAESALSAVEAAARRRWPS